MRGRIVDGSPAKQRENNRRGADLSTAAKSAMVKSVILPKDRKWDGNDSFEGEDVLEFLDRSP